MNTIEINTTQIAAEFAAKVIVATHNIGVLVELVGSEVRLWNTQVPPKCVAKAVVLSDGALDVTAGWRQPSDSTEVAILQRLI
tara:strand:- start:1493 stop:1741 length:249 start_codon:yes stop_codon:yes gene_type:complete